MWFCAQIVMTSDSGSFYFTQSTAMIIPCSGQNISCRSAKYKLSWIQISHYRANNVSFYRTIILEFCEEHIAAFSEKNDSEWLQSGKMMCWRHTCASDYRTTKQIKLIYMYSWLSGCAVHTYSRYRNGNSLPRSKMAKATVGSNVYTWLCICFDS